MATLQSAMQKWDRKMANAGQNWQAGVANAEGNYCAGVSEFMGSQAARALCDKWQANVNAVGPQGFQQAVAGKGTKWAERYVRKMTTGA